MKRRLFLVLASAFLAGCSSSDVTVECECRCDKNGCYVDPQCREDCQCSETAHCKNGGCGFCSQEEK